MQPQSSALTALKKTNYREIILPEKKKKSDFCHLYLCHPCHFTAPDCSRCCCENVHTSSRWVHSAESLGYSKEKPSTPLTQRMPRTGCYIVLSCISRNLRGTSGLPITIFTQKNERCEN